ncbi:MAG: hypothetical protein DHS20C15_02960 [Planctomycetota bacterium]|nr:MAG: hypothetical protein DHS20C15_02960 [Planctomycetota bacterium]
MGRVEEGLARLDQLDALTERVQQLAHELDRRQLNAPLQAKLTELAETGERSRVAFMEVQERVAELGRLVDARLEAVTDTPAAGPADLAERVREHLRAQGFERVQILSDLTKLDGHDGRVVFEARRNGVMHKGHVGLRDGAVVDESVRAAYSAFP